MADETSKVVEEKDFLKSLDALEALAKGEIATTEPAPAVEGELEKSAAGKDEVEVVETADELEKADPDNDDPDEDEDDPDEDETEKSFAQQAAEGSENIEKAIEVSDFLSDLVDQVGFAIDGIKKAIDARMDAMEKSLAKVAGFNGELAKSLKTSFTAMDEGMKGTHTGLEDLRKSVSEMATAPARTRKSVTTTLEKSFDQVAQTDDSKMGKKDILKAMETALEKSVEGITAMDIVRFETTGQMNPNVAKAIGFTQ